jgi:NADH dehydrogenase FAD-containing subunit
VTELNDTAEAQTMSTRTGSRTPQRAERPRVVVVGGGFGGLDAARALAGAPVDVTLIDRRNHHLFHPLLYQVATAALSPAEIAAPIRHILHRQRNAEVLLAEVTDVDTDGRTVLLGDGRELEYDYLVVAAGAGDLAAYPHQTGRPLPGTAPVAMQEARAAVAEIGPLRLSGTPAWLAWLFVHIVFLIGFRNRLLVLVQWAWSYLTWQRGARLITGWRGSESSPEDSSPSTSAVGSTTMSIPSRAPGACGPRAASPGTS